MRSLKGQWPTGVFIALVLVGLAGCTALPHEGPSRQGVERAHESNNTSGFVLIDVTSRVANYLSQVHEPSLSDRFGKGRPSRANRIGAGDILEVKIWEADPGGLFGSGQGLVDRSSIPNVVVDAGGYIQIPYAGRIRAAGRTPAQVSNMIVRNLQSKAVEPQVHVAVIKNVANVVTITGNVAQPGVYPMTLRGDTLLDMVATAGGSRAPAYETMIQFTRRSSAGVTYLEEVVNRQANNLYLAPGDKIHLERKPKTFSAFGAVLAKGKYDFGAAKLTLIEAMGIAKGGNDNRADPTGVFLMRFEPVKQAYDLAGSAVPEGAGDFVPVIYRIDLRDPNQYFFAQSINMRDKDVIYIANAITVELDKFLTIIGKGIGSASASQSLGSRL